MKNIKSLTCLSIVAISYMFITSCNSSCACGLSAEDEAYIKSAIASSQEVMNQGDRDAYGNRYTETSIFMVPNNETLIGKEEIKIYLNTFPEMTAQFDVAEVIGSCNLAVVRGAYQLNSPDGMMMDKGKWLEVWQKPDNGQWELTRDIFNSDLPIPEVGNEEESSSEEEGL